MVAATVTEETTARKPGVKICQTDTLLLVSVMEADLSEDEVNVSIEQDSIRIEITRDGFENPIMSGKLFKSVKPGQCRVRMKNDSVVIKLRKTEPGRWQSILEDETNTDSQKDTPSPEARIKPTTRKEIQQMRAPIAPRDEPKVKVEKGKKTKIVEEIVPPALQASESKVFGTLEHLKKSLFSTVGFSAQPTPDEEDDRGDVDIEGPLVKRPDPRATAE